MSTGVTNAYDLAVNLLNGIVGYYELVGVAPPAEAKVSAHATPTGLTEALVVQFDRIIPNGPAMPDRPAAVGSEMVQLRSIALTVWCFRLLQDVISGEGLEVAAGPGAAASDADAQLIMTDAYVLAKAIPYANSQGIIGVGRPRFGMGDVIPLAADGGMGGCRCSITYELV